MIHFILAWHEHLVLMYMLTTESQTLPLVPTAVRCQPKRIAGCADGRIDIRADSDRRVVCGLLSEVQVPFGDALVDLGRRDFVEGVVPDRVQDRFSVSERTPLACSSWT